MRALVLSGGGSRGAFEAGVLRSMTERGVSWDVIAGVSVGALNGCFIAQYEKSLHAKAADKLCSFWGDIRSNDSIYKRWFPFGKLHSLWRGGMFDTSPINKIVYDNVDAEKLRKSGVNLLVGSVCLESGEYYCIDQSSPDIVEYVLASAAFPVAFPPRIIDGFHWTDGGLRQITPIKDVMKLKPDHVDVVMSSHIGDRVSVHSSLGLENAVVVALRIAGIMADEIYNTDLDVLPECMDDIVDIYSPPQDWPVPDPLTFNPRQIKEFMELSMEVGKVIPR